MPGADLFVICKKCGSEVSPYVTECPYCGTRLRKRAPKLERPDRPPRRSRIPTPRLSPLRSGEIPGIRADSRPWATIAVVIGSLGVSLAWKIVPASLDIAVDGPPGNEFWRVFTAPFLYENVGYGFIALVAIATFGWLLERRHGPIVTFLVFICCAAGGTAIASLLPNPLVAGGNGGALGLIAAWAVPDLIARRRGEDSDSDLLGTAVVAGCVLLTPVVATSANWLCGVAGGVIGLVLGVPLARLHRSAAA
ncbi:MAG TPA: rhomboid family intramembrane serine protease [Solirubrobacteraceae bacterium]|nr:rhomboid family intramembrane serine protease [Solirubrobacteraceae bacterium]